MSFEHHLQQWVAIDNQMKILSDRMKELRDKKNIVTEQINTHVETSNLTNSIRGPISTNGQTDPNANF